MSNYILYAVGLLGMVINGQYFFFYFQEAGYQAVLSPSMAFTFIVFESLLWLRSSRYKWLKVSMLCFSVLVTMSAQYSSTSKVEVNSANSINQAYGYESNIDRYKDEIKNATDEINRINTMRQENFLFSRTDNDLEYYRAEKARYEQLLKKERDSYIKSIPTKKTIYDWFAYDLPQIIKNGVTSEFIRILFQAFSSFVLALVAPVCFSLIEKKEPPTEAKRLKPTTVDYSGYVLRWVNYHWVNIRTGKSDQIVSRKIFYEAMAARNIDFPEKAYDSILFAANTSKVVDKSQILCRIESEAVEKIKASLKS